MRLISATNRSKLPSRQNLSSDGMDFRISMISLNKLLTMLLFFCSSDVFAVLAAGVAGVGATAMANETESILLDDYGHICGGLP